MPALLTSSGRPGFYLRVLQEGEVCADDEIVKAGEAEERMTVAEINALLYSPNHPRDRLDHALRIEALSPGWRSSFEALLSQTSDAGSGNAGLAPAAAAHPAAPGFRPLAVDCDRTGVRGRYLADDAGAGRSAAANRSARAVRSLASPAATGGAPLFRSYSLSCPLSTERYRISVKIEPNGAAGTYLREHVRVGDVLDVSAPRGSFILQSGEAPVVLLRAGIGGDVCSGDAAYAGGSPLRTEGRVAARGAGPGASFICHRSPPPYARLSPSSSGNLYLRMRPPQAIEQHRMLDRGLVTWDGVRLEVLRRSGLTRSTPKLYGIPADGPRLGHSSSTLTCNRRNA
jgi:hypothetical protein